MLLLYDEVLFVYMNGHFYQVLYWEGVEIRYEVSKYENVCSFAFRLCFINFLQTKGNSKDFKGAFSMHFIFYNICYCPD